MTTTERSATPAVRTSADPEAVWLVTGCSSGFGQALAKALFAQGRRVVATARQMSALSYLPLHEMSINATRAKLARVAADMDRMESVALGVHYPPGASLHKAAVL
jgi:NADP-dependent 3-hydroxy acid dehydrogenase YdfG